MLDNNTDNFRQLLPFYIAGTASQKEQRFIESHIQQNPDAAEELAVAQRIRSNISQLGNNRNQEQLTAAFLEKYAREKRFNLKLWLETERDRLALWLGGAIGVPALILNALDINIADIGGAIVDFLRIPDIINVIQGLFTPMLIESLGEFVILTSV